MTITNRSRLVVSVKNSEEHRREFPFNKTKAARAYLEALRSQGYKSARVDQLEDHILVRIRATGHPELTKTFGSYEEAELFENQVLTERRQGVFIDYSKSLHTTVADLIRRYIRDEIPRQKNGPHYVYVYQAMLDDSEGLLEQQLAEREKDPSVKVTATREPMGSLEWMHKPLTEVVAADIEDWMRSREGDVKLSTIWRQYEMLRSVINLAINTWGYPLRINPTKGVRSVDFQNERDRRLVEDEFDRIMEAAQALDAERSLEHRVQELMREAMADEVFSSKSQRKHRMVAVRKEVTQDARKSYVHRPILEAYILFQVATAARRSESLTLPWRHVDLDKKTAFLPETKNGRARTLALRDDLIELLKELPRDGDLVFNLTVKTCRTSWEAIMQATQIEDLTVHDLRHEGISAAAESGMTLAELQAFSGHRDIRMLLRYTHLCMTKLADKLSAALAAGTLKNGRRRMKSGELKLADLVNAAADEGSSAPIPTPPRPLQRTAGTNVILFPRQPRENASGR